MSELNRPPAATKSVPAPHSVWPVLLWLQRPCRACCSESSLDARTCFVTGAVLLTLIATATLLLAEREANIEPIRAAIRISQRPSMAFGIIGESVIVGF
jgi:hypothetical protein